LDSDATSVQRPASGAIIAWGKSKDEKAGESARRSGADFRARSTTIARSPTRTKLARTTICDRDAVRDHGASAAIA
jgi:hypothetical protein